MKINGEYFTREEAAQVLFSDDKLFKLLKTLYVGNFIIFFLTAAFQVIFTNKSKVVTIE